VFSFSVSDLSSKEETSPFFQKEKRKDNRSWDRTSDILVMALKCTNHCATKTSYTYASHPSPLVQKEKKRK
jgi:hypothetical protein